MLAPLVTYFAPPYYLSWNTQNDDGDDILSEGFLHLVDSFDHLLELIGIELMVFWIEECLLRS